VFLILKSLFYEFNFTYYLITLAKGLKDGGSAISAAYTERARA